MSPIRVSLLATLLFGSQSLAAPTYPHIVVTSATSSQVALYLEPEFDITRHLGTKGAYPIRNDEAHQDEVNGCALAHVQMVVRHGTRAPTYEDIVSFNELEAFARSADSCLSPEHEWIRSWKNPFNLEDEGLLSKAGEGEAYLFGKRTMQRYESLLANVPYNPNVYLFSSSGRSRSGQTGSSFAAGLFTPQNEEGTCRNTPIYMTTSPQKKDHIMNPQKSCSAWRKHVQRGPAHRAEMEAFKSARLPPIARRLAETTCLTFSPANALAAFKACAFEWSVFGRRDGWCTMFNEDEVEWLEYGEDLDDWLENGYGHELNGKIACRLVTEIVQGLKARSEGNSRVIADFKFGHSETLLALVTSLGLFKDTQRLTGNATTPLPDRVFRTSHIAPFMANMAFELHQCSGSNKFKVRALLNERPIILPGCTEEACDLDVWEAALGDLVGCDIDAVCEKKKKGKKGGY
ncbi:uncharacterized protein SPPG_02135 [Spizellomyces punctatus DAOM BR117]|uniref:Multiple inositol polyphosphate phosphatase 1 n=1 Tax=Spizellomyces punctatus (strain DAOM BR117) TaxID=645134 RepID=A0A0L0HQ57_SPIPD|nr:uncharacterized protein SPPG_02135 [Spizellomyces punctatus DAOM BR117]KND03070.1 hypothetical protein SPPG_02135 [Spizellomyces punctatus DAOM BR117]|eukprot:XP_016611109.1 hypothetical protein SPPG_02135 [Spizellomyces punctatus DAOM BR117]